jgi:hypothetical protein
MLGDIDVESVWAVPQRMTDNRVATGGAITAVRLA